MLTTDLKSWVFRQRVGLCCDDVLLLLSNNGGSRLLVKDEVEFQIFFDVALGQYKIAAIDREQNKLKHLWNINSEKLEHYSIRAITLVEMQQARDRLRDFLVMQFSEGKVFASLDIVLSIEVSYRGFVEFVHEAVVNPAVASTKKGVPEVIQAWYSEFAHVLEKVAASHERQYKAEALSYKVALLCKRINMPSGVIYMRLTHKNIIVFTHKKLHHLLSLHRKGCVQ